MAVELYDRFMCKHFWKVHKDEIANDPSEASWFKVCKTTSNQNKLNLMSCFQLACKMDSHSSALGISQVHRKTICFVKNLTFRLPGIEELHLENA